MYINDIGMLIKQYRTDNNVSQKELSSAIGVAQSKLSKIESSDINPDIGLIKKISQYLNISVNSFYDRDEDMGFENSYESNSAAGKIKYDKKSLILQIQGLKEVLKHKDDLIAEYKKFISELNAKTSSQHA